MKWPKPIKQEGPKPIKHAEAKAQKTISDYSARHHVVIHYVLTYCFLVFCLGMFYWLRPLMCYWLWPLHVLVALAPICIKSHMF